MSFKNVFINLGSSYAHIVLSVLMNIMYVPIALHYLGIDRYGVWIFLQTIVNFLTMANFGIPTAVTNLMCQTDSKNKKGEILRSGFKILLFICSILFLVIFIFYFSILYFTPWLNNLTSEIKTSCIVLVMFFIIRIPFQVGSSAFIADNKIYIAKIYEFLTTAITFLSLLILVYFKQNLIFLSFLSGVLLLILNVVSYLNALKILGHTHGSHLSTQLEYKALYGPGFKLFVAGFGGVLVWNTDNILISKFLDFHEVAVYATGFRLFSFAYMTFGLIYGIIIPYYGKYFSQKDWVKLQNLFNFNISVIPFIAICVWLVGWLFAKEIIFYWLSSYNMYGGSNLYFVLGAYGVALAYVGVMFNLLSTVNLLKWLVYLTFLESIINLMFSVWFIHIIGAVGVALGTLIGSVFGSLVFLPFLIDKNKVLEFPFPFNKFILSLGFYVLMMLILYFNSANEYGIILKLVISLTYILLFILFQYNLNRKTFKKVSLLFKNK